MTLQIVMLRHATRDRHNDPDYDEYLERTFPLNGSGKSEARKTAQQLLKIGISPTVYLTSCFEHARQTGEILRDTIELAPSAEIVELVTLTPYFQGPRKLRGNGRGSDMLVSIAQESRAIGKDLRRFNTIAFILHQPRLQQLIQVMTSQSEHQFYDIRYSEGIYLRSVSFEALFIGQGKIEARLCYEGD
jgi:phosphohistidine phosphatase SixA